MSKLKCLLFLVLFYCLPLTANLPTGSTVVEGAAVIQNDSNSMQITQSTETAIIEWQSFNLAEGNTINIQQPSQNSFLLNRIDAGQGVSTIQGAITANGTIVLINPAGLIFTKSSIIDVHGLIASTAGITNDNFLNGNWHFQQDPNYPNSEVQFNGSVVTAHKGYVVLAGPHVKHTGYIVAKQGKVQLVAGTAFTIDLYGDGLINFSASNEAHTIDSTGTIEVSETPVILSPDQARQVSSQSINLSGHTQATSVSKSGGTIIFGGGAVKIANKVHAKGSEGGQVIVAANHITVDDTAEITVAGVDKGGYINIGNKKMMYPNLPESSTTIISNGSLLDASAINGNAGEIIIWSQGTTSFAGVINSKSVYGDGGFVEVSGNEIILDGKVSTLSEHGAVGTFLIDPVTYSIDEPNAATILESLDNNDVVIQADSVINVESPLIKTDLTVDRQLQLNAPNVNVLAEINLPKVELYFANKTNLALDANTTSAKITFNSDLSIAANEDATMSNILISKFNDLLAIPADLIISANEIYLNDSPISNSTRTNKVTFNTNRLTLNQGILMPNVDLTIAGGSNSYIEFNSHPINVSHLRLYTDKAFDLTRIAASSAMVIEGKSLVNNEPVTILSRHVNATVANETTDLDLTIKNLKIYGYDPITHPANYADSSLAPKRAINLSNIKSLSLENVWLSKSPDGGLHVGNITNTVNLKNVKFISINDPINIAAASEVVFDNVIFTENTGNITFGTGVSSVSGTASISTNQISFNFNSDLSIAANADSTMSNILISEFNDLLAIPADLIISANEIYLNDSPISNLTRTNKVTFNTNRLTLNQGILMPNVDLKIAGGSNSYIEFNSHPINVSYLRLYTDKAFDLTRIAASSAMVIEGKSLVNNEPVTILSRHVNATVANETTDLDLTIKNLKIYGYDPITHPANYADSSLAPKRAINLSNIKSLSLENVWLSKSPDGGLHVGNITNAVNLKNVKFISINDPINIAAASEVVVFDNVVFTENTGDIIFGTASMVLKEGSSLKVHGQVDGGLTWTLTNPLQITGTDTSVLDLEGVKLSGEVKITALKDLNLSGVTVTKASVDGVETGLKVDSLKGSFKVAGQEVFNTANIGLELKDYDASSVGKVILTGDQVNLSVDNFSLLTGANDFLFDLSTLNGRLKVKAKQSLSLVAATGKTVSVTGGLEVKDNVASDVIIKGLTFGGSVSIPNIKSLNFESGEIKDATDFGLKIGSVTGDVNLKSITLKNNANPFELSGSSNLVFDNVVFTENTGNIIFGTGVSSVSGTASMTLKAGSSLKVHGQVDGGLTWTLTKPLEITGTDTSVLDLEGVKFSGAVKVTALKDLNLSGVTVTKASVDGVETGLKVDSLKGGFKVAGQEVFNTANIGLELKDYDASSVGKVILTGDQVNLSVDNFSLLTGANDFLFDLSTLNGRLKVKAKQSLSLVAATGKTVSVTGGLEVKDNVASDVIIKGLTFGGSVSIPNINSLNFESGEIKDATDFGLKIGLVESDVNLKNITLKNNANPFELSGSSKLVFDNVIFTENTGNIIFGTGVTQLSGSASIFLKTDESLSIKGLEKKGGPVWNLTSPLNITGTDSSILNIDSIKFSGAVKVTALKDLNLSGVTVTKASVDGVETGLKVDRLKGSFKVAGQEVFSTADIGLELKDYDASSVGKVILTGAQVNLSDANFSLLTGANDFLFDLSTLNGRLKVKAKPSLSLVAATNKTVSVKGGLEVLDNDGTSVITVKGLKFEGALVFPEIKTLNFKSNEVNGHGITVAKAEVVNITDSKFESIKGSAVVLDSGKSGKITIKDATSFRNSGISSGILLNAPMVEIYGTQVTYNNILGNYFSGKVSYFNGAINPSITIGGSLAASGIVVASDSVSGYKIPILKRTHTSSSLMLSSGGDLFKFVKFSHIETGVSQDAIFLPSRD